MIWSHSWPFPKSKVPKGQQIYDGNEDDQYPPPAKARALDDPDQSDDVYHQQCNEKRENKYARDRQVNPVIGIIQAHSANMPPKSPACQPGILSHSN
jgi:hypothetical protein